MIQLSYYTKINNFLMNLPYNKKFYYLDSLPFRHNYQNKI